MKQRIVFFGTPSFVIPIVECLKEHFDIVGIITAPDTIQGRKKLLTPSPIKQFAEENLSIPVFTPVRLNAETIDQLKALTPDLFVVAAYGKIIPKDILDLPRFGAVNIHPSLLPKYRGPSPIQTTLLNGDTVSGITVIQMDELVDHGRIIAQWEIPLDKSATFESLHFSMFKDAAEHLSRILTNYMEGDLTPIAQDENKATFCEKITRESGYFDVQNPPQPQALDRMIRAYYPWPNVWTKVKIKNEERIMKFLPGPLIQLEGGKPMNIKDVLNGYPELEEILREILGK